MKLKWQQAPVKTQWGDEMVVASVAIDNDHTVCLYCEHDQTAKVEAMFTQRKPLTQDGTMEIANQTAGQYWMDEAHIQRFRAAIEAAHGIKENT